MTETNKSRVVTFLMGKKNLPAVLEILGHSHEIGREVRERFWEGLHRALRKSEPTRRGLRLLWKRDLSVTANYVGLDARVEPIAEGKQGLKYRIEVDQGYFGVGLAWVVPGENFKKRCQIKPVRLLLNGLEDKRRAYGDPAYPDENWFWWEDWESSTFSDSDPWSWFAAGFKQAWCVEKAARFWELVVQTYPLVVKANKALKAR